MDACESNPSEARVNQRGDLSEFTSHPKAATQLLDVNRILVAYVAQPVPAADSSEVRIALLDATTGERTTVCKSDFELTLSEPGTFAYSAAVAPADLTVNGLTAKAAVAWIEGQVDTRVKVLFVDDRGCPLGNPVSPLLEPGIATSGVTLAWSPTRKELLVAYQDYHRVLATWMANTNPPTPVELASTYLVDQIVTAAIAEDGRGAIGWASYASADAHLAGEVTLSVALIADDGSVRPGPNGAPEPFNVAFPASTTSGSTVDFDIAAGKNRFALAAALAESSFARQVVYVTELSADDGTVVNPPFRVEPSTGASHFYPAVTYTANGSLVAAWMAAQHGGAVARLFDAQGRPRFNAVSCDEGPFAVGARARVGMQGQPSALFAANRVWVFHPGKPAYDAVAMGVVGWNMGWSDLWPAK